MLELKGVIRDLEKHNARLETENERLVAEIKWLRAALEQCRSLSD